MRILFFMAHAGYTRNFESTLRLLAENGHSVTLAFDKQKENAGGAEDIVVALERDFERVRAVRAPERPKSDPRLLVGQQLRVVLDWMRYLAPEFRDAEKLRERAGSRVPPSVRAVLSLPLVRSRPGRAIVSLFLRGAERSVAPRQEIVDFIEEIDADLVLVTPLLEVGSPQHEYLRAARACGRRTGLCVASWDNLTTAGLVHETPDFLTVWNEPQRIEAHDLHGIPIDRVVVTGACAYDHWFDWEPSTTREEFCERAGIRADRPYVLYLCSSGFITPNEGEFVLRWIEGVRDSLPPDLRETGIVVRPHPTNPMEGKDGRSDAAERLVQLENVTVWPSSAMNPTNRAAREIYYDSIHHAAAVVGVNTSGQIESAIVGRRVLTVFAPEYRGTQEGTLHYHHLLSVNGGLLDHAETWKQHVAQLADALRRDTDARESARSFLEGFVRPFGLDDAATPRMLAAFESAAAAPAPAPSELPAYAPLYRPLLALAAAGVARFSERGKRARTDRARKPSAQAARRAPARRGGRAPWNPLTWLFALARGVLAALLAVPLARSVLYRHVRPALLSAVVLIERSARPTGRPSRALREAQGEPDAAPAKRKPKPAPVAAAKEVARQKTPAKPGAADWNKRVASLVRGSHPVVAGPWLGGMAAETAVWIPFLRYLAAQWPGLSERLVAVSRGGVAPWYGEIAGRYVDLSEIYDVPSRLVFEQAASFVDRAPDARFARAVTEGIRALLGDDAAILDPGDVVPAITTSSNGSAPFRYAALDAPADRPAWLPERYVAASFTAGEAFPDSPENRRAALVAVERAAATAPVVLLADDYGILDGAPGPLREQVAVAPADRKPRSLAAGVAVLAYADAVVGSLEGTLAAAAAQGRHVVSLCSNPRAVDEARLALVRAASAGAGGRLVVLHTADVEGLFAAPFLTTAPGEPAEEPTAATAPAAAVGN